MLCSYFRVEGKVGYGRYGMEEPPPLPLGEEGRAAEDIEAHEYHLAQGGGVRLRGSG